MPEACFLCLDSSEYMRNGDQFPNRLMAEQEAANLLVNAKVQVNAENTIGFLVMGGNACTVFETLTPDVDRVMASIANISIAGPTCHFANGLLIASLALSHRTNPRAEKRIVAFVGSPLHETAAALEALARRLRRDEVAVDVVAFGVAANVPLLRDFVRKVNKQGNSHFLDAAQAVNLSDALLGSPVMMLGEDAAGPGGIAADGGAAGQTDLGFGVDPNVDPELAMVLRMSMEEERQRQAAAAAAAAANATNANAPASPPSSANEANAVPPAAAAAAPPTATAPAPATHANAATAEEDWDNMTEEELLQRAVQLSLQEAAAAQHPQAPPSSATAPSTLQEANEEAEDEGHKSPSQHDANEEQ